MTGKETILQSIEKNKPEPKPLPEDFVCVSGSSETGLLAELEKNLLKAGAEVSSCFDAGHEGLADFRDRKQWEKYPATADKKDLEQIGTAVIEGQFGVAENGAIWLSDSDFPHRLVPFIPEELIILLNKNRIVRNMHEAYRSVKLKDVAFGIFVSGPSKTADIEQSLVYGAHGPRKLTVVLY